MALPPKIIASAQLKEELPYLSYTVYILSEPKPVKDIKDLDPKKFGIIVKTTPFAYPDENVGWFDGHTPFKSGFYSQI